MFFKVCWNSGRFEHRRLISPLTAPSGPFGDPLCDSPPLLVASAMSFMKDMLADRADFVLWTGNSLPQNPKFELDEEGEEDERRLAALDRVTSIFRLNFPYTTIYPALGNLDFGGESAFGGGGGGDLAGGRHHRRRKRRRRKHRTRNRNKGKGRPIYLVCRRRVTTCTTYIGIRLFGSRHYNWERNYGSAVTVATREVFAIIN